MVLTVARATGRPVREVLEQPFALTLWTWMELTDLHRIDALLDDNRDIRSAARTAIAFHDPEKLNDERMEWESRAAPGDQSLVDTLMAQARQMQQNYDRDRT